MDIDVNGAAKSAATQLQEKDEAVTLSTPAVRVNNDKNTERPTNVVSDGNHNRNSE